VRKGEAKENGGRRRERKRDLKYFWKEGRSKKNKT